MGLFDKFKKVSANPQLSENDALTEIFKLISESDADVLNQAKSCISYPRTYADTHADDFLQRGIDVKQAKDSELKWIGCTDILIKYGYAQEIDYDCEPDDFLFLFEKLKTIKDMNVGLSEIAFSENEDVNSWCEQIDRYFKKQKMCVGAIDIDSDSYIVFLTETETLDRLSDLAQSVSRRIAYAKEM